MIIDDSEKEDFISAIRGRDLDPSDFELSEEEDPMKGRGVQPVTGRVIIKRISTGIEKTYKAGHFSSWPAEFEQDLKRGIFN